MFTFSFALLTKRFTFQTGYMSRLSKVLNNKCFSVLVSYIVAFSIASDLGHKCVTQGDASFTGVVTRMYAIGMSCLTKM